MRGLYRFSKEDLGKGGGGEAVVGGVDVVGGVHGMEDHGHVGVAFAASLRRRSVMNVKGWLFFLFFNFIL